MLVEDGDDVARGVEWEVRGIKERLGEKIVRCSNE